MNVRLLLAPMLLSACALQPGDPAPLDPGAACALPGARSCASRDVYACLQGRWIYSHTCPTDLACSSGSCVSLTDGQGQTCDAASCGSPSTDACDAGTCDGGTAAVNDDAGRPQTPLPDAGHPPVDSGTADAGGCQGAGCHPSDAGAPDAGGCQGVGCPPTCATGARRCAGGDVQVCDGSGWILEQSCGSDSTCEAGACVPLYNCDLDCGGGAAFCDTKPCSAGAGVCWSGLCIPPQCRSGDSQCGGNTWVLNSGTIECADTRSSGNEHWLNVGHCGASIEWGDRSPDHAWGFLPTATRQHTVTVTTLEPWDVVIHVLSGACASSFGCYGHANATGKGGSEKVTFQAVSGNAYIIVVDGAEDGTVAGGPLAARSGFYTISID